VDYRDDKRDRGCQQREYQDLSGLSDLQDEISRFRGLGHSNKAERNRGKGLNFQLVGEARIRFGVPRDSLARDGCDGMSRQLEAPIV